MPSHSMQFFANTKTNNHHTILLHNLKKYKQAFFAVAFLKISGLNKLLKAIDDFLASGGKIIIIVGQNFALTEPGALHELRKRFQYHRDSKIYLDKGKSTTSIFHPKLYLFKSDAECCIISGSANITEGGLISNKETSLVAFCNDMDSSWTEAETYFNGLISPDNADEASLLVIKQYETFYEQQKSYNKKAKAIPSKTKSQLNFDYENLLEHFEGFDNAEREEDYNNKLRHYREAKKVLDQIADNPALTQAQFEPLLDKLVGKAESDRLWHSGSLFRLRNKVYPHFRRFRDLVRYIRENKSSSPAIIFKGAKEKVEMIEGAAVNYIAEIMMTYNYQDFANMNRNPITVLKDEGGVNIKAHSSSFTPNDYEEYCELVKEISDKLGLKDMLEADSFFNKIYWDINK